MRRRSQWRRESALRAVVARERAERRVAEERGAAAAAHGVYLAEVVGEQHDQLVSARQQIEQQSELIVALRAELCMARSETRRAMSAWRCARLRAARWYARAHVERERGDMLARQLAGVAVIPGPRQGDSR